MNYYIDAFKQYAVFTGRATRRQYWMFFLFNFIVACAILFVETLLGIPMTISSLYSLAVLVPSIAIAVRRLHDTDRSGWWVLINLLPLVGFIILVIFLVMESDPNDNRFGPNPHGAASGEPAAA